MRVGSILKVVAVRKDSGRDMKSKNFGDFLQWNLLCFVNVCMGVSRVSISFLQYSSEYLIFQTRRKLKELNPGFWIRIFPSLIEKIPGPDPQQRI